MSETTMVPADWPVMEYRGPDRPGIAECGTCGRRWDDEWVTSMTPAPAGRCPFEVFHEDASSPASGGDDVERWARVCAEAAGASSVRRLSGTSVLELLARLGAVRDELEAERCTPRVVPGGPGEDGFLRVTVSMLVTRDELRTLAGFLANQGWYELSDMLEDAEVTR